MSDLPTIITAAGLQPQAPVDLRTQLINLVAASNPGYTSDLPGTLIEDIASTDVGALVLMDQARIALINSLTPFGANVFLLTQLGNIYGVPQGGASNTTVQVVFTGSPGFTIPVGFVVSDGQHQYVVTDGGILNGAGTSGNMSTVATQTGSWAVPANTVTQLVTQPPAGVSLSVDNPLSGTPGGAAQTMDEYRAQVLRAGLAASQSMARFVKTLLRNVQGAQERLIAVRQKTPQPGQCGAWEIIVGGTADNYQVANAIFLGIADISSLQGSTINVTGITNASPGVVTTDLTHGLTTGEATVITGLNGMTPLNGLSLAVTVLDPHTFSVGVDTTFYPPWISGGVVSPNSRNVVVTIDDYPDVYTIPFVVPPQQTVTIIATWNTTDQNFVSDATVAALASPALVNYVNSIAVGQPIILYELESTFSSAVANVLAPQQLTRMVFTVDIDGVGVLPESGTGIIAGDPESFLFASAASVQVTRG